MKGSDLAIKWQMGFNVDKCKVVHKGENGPYLRYEKSGSDLVITSQESPAVMKMAPWEYQPNAQQLSKNKKY